MPVRGHYDRENDGGVGDETTSTLGKRSGSYVVRRRVKTETW